MKKENIRWWTAILSLVIGLVVPALLMVIVPFIIFMTLESHSKAALHFGLMDMTSSMGAVTVLSPFLLLFLYFKLRDTAKGTAIGFMIASVVWFIWLLICLLIFLAAYDEF